MKETLKRAFLALIMSAAVIFSGATAVVFAEPEGEAVPTPIVAEANNNLQTERINTQNSQPVEKSGMSVGGVLVLMLAVIVINAALSFVISNRFYKMSKRDGHLHSEIRALRRDIDDKFSGNVTQLKERSVTVKNTNKDYSRGGGITYKEEKPDEVSEIAKRWNIQIEEETEPQLKMKSPAATRAEYRERHPSVKQKRDAEEGASVKKSKARKLLGDIFPFDEE